MVTAMECAEWGRLATAMKGFKWQQQWLHWITAAGNSNGVLQMASTEFTDSTELGNKGIRLMRRWDAADYVGGNLAIVRIYNRALSATEVATNFASGQTRFGLSWTTGASTCSTCPAGTYSAVLTVTDNEGATASSSKTMMMTMPMDALLILLHRQAPWTGISRGYNTHCCCE
jgi:hypothetical protein